VSKILVLCHGNYMRSPACEAVLLAEGLEVESAGFHPRAGRAAKKMRLAMAARGYTLEQHKPRMVTEEMVNDARLVLLMDGGNADRFNKMFLEPEQRLKVRCLGHYIQLGRIQDPAFQSEPRFSEIVDEIIRASAAVAADWRLKS